MPSNRLESLLLGPAEAAIERELQWGKIETDDGSALYSPTALETLSKYNLEHMFMGSRGADFLDTIPVHLLDSGSHGSVYEIDGTELVVKKHFPDHYIGGHEGRSLRGPTYMKRISGNSILRSLKINLDLEIALRNSPDYTTPKYLGHIMLDVNSGVRHYTVMTRLNEVTQTDEQEAARIAKLKQKARTSCISAMKAAGRPTKFVDWDIEHERGYHNVIPVMDEEHGLVLAIIDQQTLFSSSKKLVGAPLISRRTDDPDAPWLATSGSQMQTTG